MTRSAAAVQSLDGAVTNKPNTKPNTNPNPKIIQLVTEAHFQAPTKIVSNAK